ncbi:hypothetical protein BZG36_01504 [Bifiguratus adelaidae]|uniref:Surfeit locus protein 4 n=1 Tax=Bifiguratus adelaidae TaxID=1938954 RepID=A0A261Y4S8_9FUNG|nr:hypothetical protein BZG36_01504 [Bifiguratus adelaidae]
MSNELQDQIRALSLKAEDVIDRIGQPLKPYIPAIARFLIVVTFYEDALRILTQFGDQTYFLEKHRHFPWGLSHIFLLLNVVTMVAGSSLVIAKRYTEYAFYGLAAVIVTQAFAYGLVFDLSFLFRNLSVIGGLLMVLSDSLNKRRQMFAALPTLSETDRRKYFQLAGRVLLIFLFIGFIFKGEWSLGRVIVSLMGLGACGMVAIGFKAKWSAMFLVLLLSISNVLINNWWSVHAAHPQRDFLKYDFFQTLSIMGGLLLLVSMGPGGLSMDEKKKEF